MNRMKKIGVILVGAFVAVLSNVHSSYAYNTIFFDSSVNLASRRMDVYVKEESLDSEVRGEEEYVREYGSLYPRSAKRWNNKFNPESGEGPYKAKDLDVFSTWAKKEKSSSMANEFVTKKVTVPSMKLVSVNDNKTVANLTSSYNIGMSLEDAVLGYDRESGNLGMIDGVNQILAKIEQLKGGFETDADFKQVLMGLGYLFTENGVNKVEFEVGGPSEEIEINDTSDINKAEDAEDSKDINSPSYRGNGNNIVVTMEGTGVTRTVTVKQPGNKDAKDGIMWQKRMLIKAYTGFTLSGPFNPSEKGSRIVFKDDKDTSGKPRTYYNANDLKGKEYTADDIKYLELSDLIAHALIKEKLNITDSAGKMGLIESKVYGLFDSLLTAFESGLGLATIEELVYNISERTNDSSVRGDYVLGMYPRNWTNLIATMFSFIGLVSIGVLIFSVLKIFYKMTLDSMNVASRFSLKEESSQILQTVFGLMLFLSGFAVLALVNYTFVGTIYDSIGGGEIILGGSGVTSSGFANIIIRIMLIGVKVYINVLYVVRSLNLGLLLALSPAFIVSIAFGKKQLFATYMKELVGTLFLQSFHAVLLLFIFEAQTQLGSAGGAAGIFSSAALTLALLPITKTFKMLVMPSALMEAGQGVAAQAKGFTDSKIKGGWNKVKDVATKNAAESGGALLEKMGEGGTDLMNSVGTMGENAKKLADKKVLTADKDEVASSLVDIQNNIGNFDEKNSEGAERLKALGIDEETAEKINELSKLDQVSNEDAWKNLNKAKFANNIAGIVSTLSGDMKGKGAARERRKALNETGAAMKQISSVLDSDDKTRKSIRRAESLASERPSSPGIWLEPGNEKSSYAMTEKRIDEMGYSVAVGDGGKTLGCTPNENMFDNKNLPSGAAYDSLPKDMRDVVDAQRIINETASKIDKEYTLQAEIGRTVEDGDKKDAQIGESKANIEKYKSAAERKLERLNVKTNAFEGNSSQMYRNPQSVVISKTVDDGKFMRGGNNELIKNPI